MASGAKTVPSTKKNLGARWLPIIAICGALAVGCVIAWQSYQRHHAAAAVDQPQPEPGHAVIYPDGSQAESDLSAALAQAAKEHKRVLVDFGGNWCGDCQILEMYFHDPANQPLLESHYVLVPINIGHMDQNRDIAARYGVPVDKGVPALAVLGEDGQLVYSQRHGEFEALHTMDSAAVTAFLQQWKG